MLYFICGPDGYRRQKRLSEIVSLRREKYPQLSFRKFDLESEDLVELLDFVTSQNLFEMGKRMAVLEGISSDTDGEILKAAFEKSSLESIILIVNQDWKEIPKYLKEAIGEKEFKKEIFNNLEPDQMADFVCKECQALEIEADVSSIKFLIRVLGRDLWSVINEIKRLSCLRKPITMEMLKNFGKYSDDFGIFDFSRRFSSGNLAERLFYWEIVLLKKIELFAVFNYLAKSSFGKNLNYLAKADIKIKSGLLLPDQALLEVILK